MVSSKSLFRLMVYVWARFACRCEHGLGTNSLVFISVLSCIVLSCYVDLCLVVFLSLFEGHFTPSKKRTRFFQNKRIFTDF